MQPLRSPRSEPRDLWSGLLSREAWAERQLVERFSPHIERILVRVGGVISADLDDKVQETLLRVFVRVAELREPERLAGFVTQVAVNVARESLRAKRRRRWLSFFSPSRFEELTDHRLGDDSSRDAVAAAYRILDTMDDDLRIAFVLRYVEGMELVELSEACGTSVATVKRRLTEANLKFKTKARSSEALVAWMDGAAS